MFWIGGSREDQKRFQGNVITLKGDPLKDVKRLKLEKIAMDKERQEDKK
ncbi:MAG: hypothetical protein QXO44_03640 [Thermoplasmatales archaeon]